MRKNYQQGLCVSQINIAPVHKCCSNLKPQYAVFVRFSIRLPNEQMHYRKTKDTETKYVWTICVSSFRKYVYDIR